MTEVKIHSPAEIEMARAAGQAAAKVLEMIKPYVLAGITTDEIDRLCHDYIVNELKVIPANIGYHGYTRTVCTSVNHVVCHGIPSDKKTQERRYCEYRCGDHQRGLVWRYQQNVLCWGTLSPGQTSGRYYLSIHGGWH